MIQLNDHKHHSVTHKGESTQEIHPDGTPKKLQLISSEAVSRVTSLKASALKSKIAQHAVETGARHTHGSKRFYRGLVGSSEGLVICFLYVWVGAYKTDPRLELRENKRSHREAGRVAMIETPGADKVPAVQEGL